MEDTLLRDNISKYYHSVEMPGGYDVVTPNVLETIDLYYNGRFKTGPYDASGFRKFFYNITKPPCDVATKFVDIDTKHIKLVSQHSGHEFSVFLMQQDLKQWLKEQKFSVLLNEISHDYPKYGTVVVKKVNGGVKKVQIHNMRMDPTVASLKESDFVYEAMVMSESEIDAMPWDEDAKAELFQRGKEDSYLLYDTYTKKGKKWQREIRADVFSYKTKQGETVRGVETLIAEKKNEYIPSLVLFEETVSELPYRELHWEKIPGRWLGFGFAEYLEDNQVAVNEAENLERKGLMFTSLKLYQTRDDQVGGTNILTNAENGDILRVESEITPLAMEERNLAAFNATRDRWNQNTERKTFSFDISRGENLPSRTPLGVANLSAGMVTSYFDIKRENFGEFVRYLIMDDILPSFKMNKTKEHVLSILSSDEATETLDDFLATAAVGEAVGRETEATGFYPPKASIDASMQTAKRVLSKKKIREFKIPSGYYAALKYGVDVDVTGEAVDIGGQSTGLQLALQILGTNPAVVQNKMTRTILFRLLEMWGVNPTDLRLNDEQEQPVQAQMPNAGSLSAPSPSPSIIQQTQQV